MANIVDVWLANISSYDQFNTISAAVITGSPFFLNFAGCCVKMSKNVWLLLFTIAEVPSLEDDDVSVDGTHLDVVELYLRISPLLGAVLSTFVISLILLIH